MPSLRVAFQHQLTQPEFTEAMLVELDGLEEERLKALNTFLLLSEKESRQSAYNKKVKGKSFEEGDLVWKRVLLSCKGLLSRAQKIKNF